MAQLLAFEEAMRISHAYLLDCDETGRDYSGFWCPVRVDRDTLPDGWYAYDARSGNDMGRVQIEKGYVFVNHYFTFLTPKEIKFPDGKDVMILWDNETQWRQPEDDDDDDDDYEDDDDEYEEEDDELDGQVSDQETPTPIKSKSGRYPWGAADLEKRSLDAADKVMLLLEYSGPMDANVYALESPARADPDGKYVFGLWQFWEPEEKHDPGLALATIDFTLEGLQHFSESISGWVEEATKKAAEHKERKNQE